MGLTLRLYLIWHLSFEIHGKLQHVVIGFARKQDFSRIEFVQGATYRPHVNPIVIAFTYNWKRTKCYMQRRNH